MQYFSIKNWDKYQHYKDRNPPWIKLNREVIDDYDICRLQDASRLLQILLWVLASQTNNRIPNDPEWIQNRLNLNTKVNLKELIDKGFIVLEESVMQNASIVLAKCSPYREETETETETETEVKNIKSRKRKSNKLLEYTQEFNDFWKAYPKNNGTKYDAFELFSYFTKNAIDPKIIISGARSFAILCLREGKELKYIPHASTWLNKRGWEADIAIKSSDYLPDGRPIMASLC